MTVTNMTEECTWPKKNFSNLLNVFIRLPNKSVMNVFSKKAVSSTQKTSFRSNTSCFACLRSKALM